MTDTFPSMILPRPFQFGLLGVRKQILTVKNRHSRANLPKYAVPIFIRLVSEPLSTGNHKQNKVPLKAEGVDPDKVSSGDAIYWTHGDTYVPFTRAAWEGLSQGRARL